MVDGRGVANAAVADAAPYLANVASRSLRHPGGQAQLPSMALVWRRIAAHGTDGRATPASPAFLAAPDEGHPCAVRFEGGQCQYGTVPPLML